MKTLADWPRVKRVLEGALECEDAAARGAYLADACGSDAELRARVDRLLAARDRVETFLETPAAVLFASQLREDLSGRVVHAYHLISRLGAGGMGEVYLAHDSKLDRPVALKFLSPDVAADGDRLRRFHQEARAASSLNHPHLVVVHDFGELDGRPYIVTELIEGETLRSRLRRGPLPIDDVVDIGVQVAGALGAAHARGVVHRDIKPENVMVRPDGYAKVLDFGIAKIAPVKQASDPFDADWRTQPGMVIGTPLYMSPEQARGLDLDARTDVWSLGVVLHEMATGALPVFPLRASGAIGDGHRPLPPELVAIVGKALHTVPDQRYQNAAELCADLKQVPRGTASSRRARWLSAAAIVAIALASLAIVPWMRGHREPAATGVQKSVAVLPFDNVSGSGGIDYLRLALADEVATALSSTPSLAVRPMAASRKFAGSGVNAREAGRELHAGGVVTGHFAVHQSELRVTVEAVDVDGNRVLWRETIAAPAHDAIVLRDRLTSRIREGLLPALGLAAPAASRARPRNAAAYALYLKSLALSTDPQPNRDAIAMLQQARAMDPDDAAIWDALGLRFYRDAHYGGGGDDGRRQAEAAIRQALALDPNRTTATVQLLILQVEAGRLQDAYDSALRLVAQRPESGEARFVLSYVLRYGGLLVESARACEEAVARDPTNPLFRTCAQPSMLTGKYDRALDFVRLDAGSEWARVVTRVIYQRMGARDAARELHQQTPPAFLRGLAPESYYGFLARCLADPAPAAPVPMSHDDVRAFLAIREDPEPLYLWASELAYCGDADGAVWLLRQSIQRNFCAAAAIETDPTFAAIRSRPEYGNLLAAARACRDRFREHVKARTPTSGTP